jgi:hypothetical protein
LNHETYNELQEYLYGWYLDGKKRKEAQKLAFEYFGQKVAKTAAKRAFSHFDKDGMPKVQKLGGCAAMNHAGSFAINEGK